MHTLASLVDELTATHHVGRLRRMLELGRLARQDPGARALLDQLAGGDVFQRRLALTAEHTRRDGGRVLAFLRDESRALRTLAFSLVPLACDEPQALEALQLAFAVHQDRELVRVLARRGRRSVVDRYLDWLAAQPGVRDFAELVPFATTDGLRRHLPRALARPSAKWWRRLVRNAPETFVELLADRLRAVPGEPDPVTRQLLEAHTAELVLRAPDAGATLLELLLERGIQSQPLALSHLARLRPDLALDLIERHDLRPSAALFAKTAAVLPEATLLRAVRRAPPLLGWADVLARDLAPALRAKVAAAWAEQVELHPAWGLELLTHVEDEGLRARAWARWSIAARDADGVIAPSQVALLPADLRAREAKRHLDEVVALRTRPTARLTYARFLGWDDAQAALQPYLGHPEGDVRGRALATLLAIAGLRPAETALPEKALALVLARKNEQDPVRMAVLEALVAWPRAVWRPEHAPLVHRILRDALDAGDLSHGTAQVAEKLLIRTFRLDPAQGAVWLGTFTQERGQLYDARLGAHLDDDELRAAAPHLLAVARTWAGRERTGQLLVLAESLAEGPRGARGPAERLAFVRGLAELLEEVAKESPLAHVALSVELLLLRFARPRFEAGLAATVRRWFDLGWVRELLALAAYVERPRARPEPLHPELTAALERIARGRGHEQQVAQAVTLLSVRAHVRFDELLPALLAADESLVCLPVVHQHLHRRRQDLLGSFLGVRVIEGRFATGRTAWLLPFSDGFHRWTPAQNTTFGQSLAAVARGADTDTPTVWRMTAVMAALDSAPMDALAALADDPRPAVQERALRVMARCDRGQCVPTLIRCLGDARARIAVYGLRRALLTMFPERAFAILRDAPLTKVTVAKEVLRLLGELRTDLTYPHLLALDQTPLHRDVRIALLRALWDHLERDPTWAVLERAARGPDWVMASRLGDIPADRLTVESDRRLSALLGTVLDRPEPEARIALLQRASQLAITDRERTFLTACSQRLRSELDDEVRAATMAILYRSTEDDLTRLPGLLAVAMEDARCLHVAVRALLSVRIRARASWVGAARAAADVLARAPRWVGLRIQCAAAAASPAELGALLAQLGDQGALQFDALTAATAAISALPGEDLPELFALLAPSPHAELRRLAVTTLALDAGPGRGWTEARLASLAALAADPTPLVSGAARAVFPPREALTAR